MITLNTDECGGGRLRLLVISGKWWLSGTMLGHQLTYLPFPFTWTSSSSSSLTQLPLPAFSDYWSTCSANKHYYRQQLHRYHYQGHLHHMLPYLQYPYYHHHHHSATVGEMFLTNSNWQLCVDQQVGGNGGLGKYVNAIIRKYFVPSSSKQILHEYNILCLVGQLPFAIRYLRHRDAAELLTDFAQKTAFIFTASCNKTNAKL